MPASPMPESEREALHDEFVAYYHAAYPRLVGQVHAITGDAAAAHHAVQEAFARAWRRWATVRALDDPASWVRRVALRVRGRRRWSGRHADPSGEWLSDPDQAAAMDPENLVVLDALRRLSEPERLVLVLHHMAGLEVAQIADEEGVAEETVAARLAQGRAALADLLVDDPDDAGVFEEGLQ